MIILLLSTLLGCSSDRVVGVPNIKYQACCEQKESGEVCYLCFKRSDMQKWMESK